MGSVFKLPLDVLKFWVQGMAGADIFVFPASPWEGDAHGRSSRPPTGEIGLSEIHIVFAEVFICPETMKLHQESLRESHFEATATCFEYSMESQGFPRGGPGKPVRDPRKSLGTPRNRAWVPESILSKDVHESTWGAFLSSRWTF